MGDVAELLGVSERTAWTLVGRGELRSIRIGKRRLVPRQAIEQFIDARLQEEAA